MSHGAPEHAIGFQRSQLLLLHELGDGICKLWRWRREKTPLEARRCGQARRLAGDLLRALSGNQFWMLANGNVFLLNGPLFTVRFIPSNMTLFLLVMYEKMYSCPVIMVR